MTPLFKKLQFKDQKTVHIIDAPESFDTEMSAMETFVNFKKTLEKGEKTPFLLVFCQKQADLDAAANLAQTHIDGDGMLWICYPKGTSKKYTCDFNRDTGWELLGKSGFEPVRAVAVDADWSALRLRRVEFIKTMTRSFALTEEGKNRTKFLYPEAPLRK
jgi:hypothetical protein